MKGKHRGAEVAAAAVAFPGAAVTAFTLWPLLTVLVAMGLAAFGVLVWVSR